MHLHCFLAHARKTSFAEFLEVRIPFELHDRHSCRFCSFPSLRFGLEILGSLSTKFSTALSAFDTTFVTTPNQLEFDWFGVGEVKFVSEPSVARSLGFPFNGGGVVEIA